MSKFAQALLIARRRAQLTQAQAAEAVQLGLNTLQRIESGRHDCNRRTAAALVRFYGLPPETMLL